MWNDFDYSRPQVTDKETKETVGFIGENSVSPQARIF